MEIKDMEQFLGKKVTIMLGDHGEYSAFLKTIPTIITAIVRKRGYDYVEINEGHGDSLYFRHDMIESIKEQKPEDMVTYYKRRTK